MVRRIATVFSLLIVTILMSACSKKSNKKIVSSNYLDEFVRYEDYDGRGETFMDHKGLRTQTEDGFYFLLGQYIFVFDYKTKQTVPLCTKVDCLHNAETDERKVPECDAFCTPDTFIGYYDGHIYTVCPNRKTGDSYYVKMNPDGTDRVELAPYTSMKDLYVRMHRGVIYRSYVGNDYDGNRSYRLEAMSIAGDSTEFKPVWEGNLQRGQILYITAYQNYVMFCDQNDEVNNQMIYNIRTKEAHNITEKEYYANLGFCREGVLLRGTNDYYVYSLEDQQIHPADPMYHHFQEEHPEWTCFFSEFDETMNILLYLDSEKNFRTSVIDKQGNCLFDFEEDMSIYLSHGSFLMDGEEYLIFVERDETGYSCINAYRKEDLLEQKKNPVTLLHYNNVNDYLNGAIYHHES